MADLTARDEVRVSEFGLLRCPSCGELAAEILGRHCLILLLPAGEDTRPGCECRDGRPVRCSTLEELRAAANVALADDVVFRENLAWTKLGMPAFWDDGPASPRT